jgi:hypothetical protein
MAWNAWTYPHRAPAPLGLIDPSKPSLVLKHHFFYDEQSRLQMMNFNGDLYTYVHTAGRHRGNC